MQPVCHSPPPPATFHAHLADEGGVGEGGPDVRILVEFMILGQFWRRQGADEVAICRAQLGEKNAPPLALT